MRKIVCRQVAIGMTLGVLVFLSGCAEDSNTVDSSRSSAESGLSESSWLAGVEPEVVSEWPENDFTGNILKPEVGEISIVYDGSEEGRFAIDWAGIDQESSNAYVDSLKEQGYTEIEYEGNDVSAGTMLQKDNIYLNIAYSGENIVILITDADRIEE